MRHHDIHVGWYGVGSDTLTVTSLFHVFGSIKPIFRMRIREGPVAECRRVRTHIDLKHRPARKRKLMRPFHQIRHPRLPRQFPRHETHRFRMILQIAALVVLGIVSRSVVCQVFGAETLVELEVVVAGDDEFEFCGDGGEHSEGFAEGGYATDAGKLAAVEENVGLRGGEVEGEDRCRGGGEVVGV